MTCELDRLGAKRYPASAVVRRLRIDISNGLYHLTSRGPERGALAYEHRDPEHGLEPLGRERRPLCRIGRGGRAFGQMSNVTT